MGIIDYKSPLRVLLSTKGHPFERDPFFEVFESFQGIAHTAVEQPATQQFLSPSAAGAWDALCFYDMPGIDFSSQPPGLIDPTERMKSDFLDLLRQGKGMVFLHHALAGWPTWEAYGEIVGGRFFYLPSVCRGESVLDSGYRHDVEHTIQVLQTDHPVTFEVDPSFTISDELYLAEIFDDSIIPLLSSNYHFENQNFYSAHHAVTGSMFCNDDWPHPDGSTIIGWIKHYENSPIVYLQPGDGPSTYRDENFRKLLENALRWVASDSAHQWARERNRTGLAESPKV